MKIAKTSNFRRKCFKIVIPHVQSSQSFYFQNTINPFTFLTDFLPGESSISYGLFLPIIQKFPGNPSSLILLWVKSNTSRDGQAPNPLPKDFNRFMLPTKFCLKYEFDIFQICLTCIETMCMNFLSPNIKNSKFRKG